MDQNKNVRKIILLIGKGRSIVRSNILKITLSLQNAKYSYTPANYINCDQLCGANWKQILVQGFFYNMLQQTILMPNSQLIQHKTATDHNDDHKTHGVDL